MTKRQVMEGDTQITSWWSPYGRHEDTGGDITPSDRPQLAAVFGHFRPMNQNTVVDNIYLMPKVVWSSDKLENIIAERISKVPEVEYILLSKIENYYEIWTVINKLDRGVREQIYDVEFNILRTFRGLYFDFHVICRNDRDIKEFYSSNTKIIFQRMV